MCKLYDLTAEHREIEDAIDDYAEENDGLIDPNLESLLERCNLKRDKKLAGLWYLIKNAEAEREMIATEAQRLAARKKTLGNKIDALKSYVLSNLDEGEKFEKDLARFSTTKRTVLDVADEGAVPAAYIDYTPKLRKADITKALKEGAEVEGAALVKKLYLRIG